MKKENKNDSIQIIIYILAMVIILLLFILAYSFRVSASPMRDDTVSVNVTIEQVKKYIDNTTGGYCAEHDVLYDNLNAASQGITSCFLGFPVSIDDIVICDMTKSIVVDEFEDAYNNDDLQYFVDTFNISTELDLHNLDGYLFPFCDYIIENVNDDIVLYYPLPISSISDYCKGRTDSNGSLATLVHRRIVEEFFNHDLAPCAFLCFYDQWSSWSLNNFNGSDSSVNALVWSAPSADGSTDVSSWSKFKEDFVYIRANGCTPYINRNQFTQYNLFFCNENGRFNFNNITNNKIGDYSAYNYLILNPYNYNTSYNSNSVQACIVSSDTSIPLMIFRTDSLYLNYVNSSTKAFAPYDFSSQFPNTDFTKVDFQKIIDAIHDSDALETKNLTELYSHLEKSITKGMQDIVDSQKTTNDLLLALLRYYDINIVKDDYNITDILLDISSSVCVIRDNILFTDDDYDSLSDEVNQVFENSQIKHKLENTFPFSVKRDFEHVLDYFDEDIIETNPRFVFNFDLFHDEVHDYVEFDVDLTQLPGITIFRSFFHAFIVILFNFACFKLYDKFLTWYLS